MAWNASLAHRTGENEKKKIMIKLKKVGPNVERLWLQTFEKGTSIYTVYICIRIEKKYLNKVRRVRTTF